MRRWAILASAALVVGCANNSLVRFEALAKQTASQDFLSAAHQVRKERDLYGHSDLLYAMDLGILYHYAGRYDSSIFFLQKAVKIQDEIRSKTKPWDAVGFIRKMRAANR